MCHIMGLAWAHAPGPITPSRGRNKDGTQIVSLAWGPTLLFALPLKIFWEKFYGPS
jgi:hypothetical protein